MTLRGEQPIVLHCAGCDTHLTRKHALRLADGAYACRACVRWTLMLMRLASWGR